jgi:hypothetical protein
MNVEASRRFDELSAEYGGLMGEICAPYPGALEWWESFKGYVLTWDHIVDEGDEICVNTASASLEACLVDWPRNQFYMAFMAQLTPVIFNAVTAWKWSNVEGNPKIKAYDVYTEVGTTIAWLLHSKEKATEYSMRIRNMNREIEVVDDVLDGGRK